MRERWIEGRKRWIEGRERWIEGREEETNRGRGDG